MRSHPVTKILVATTLLVAVAITGTPGVAAPAETPTGSVQSIAEVKHDSSSTLATLIAGAEQGPQAPASPLLSGPRPPEPPAQRSRPQSERGQEPASVQRAAVASSMPSPAVSFDGLRHVRWVPPDPNGDVGPNSFMESVNTDLAVYDKSGNVLVDRFHANALFGGFGGACEDRNDGDGIVQYDPIADRWVFSQFALPKYPDPPFYQCFAISQTPDPAGAWFRYQFQTPGRSFFDYPKLGVWPDAYYMTANRFGPIGWHGADVFAFDRAAMLSGTAATMLYEHLPRPNWGLVPSDVENSSAPPPVGEPGHFLGFRDRTHQDSLWEYDFHVDFATPANAVLTGPVPLPVDAFDHHICRPNYHCVPQLDSARLLWPVAAVLMYPLAYYNYGSHEDMVITQTVTSGKRNSAVRWYQLRSAGGPWSILQQGTYSPDHLYRWMPSAALDAAGDLAIGYSASSRNVYPSIRYSGRLAVDPLGTLPQGEGIIMSGGGSQTRSGRWGDYTSMQIDPSDGCTFWYTNEYYPKTSREHWHTRVATFRYPGCP